MPAQRISQPYNVAPAEWRQNEVTPPPAPAPTMPFVVEKSSRLPWIIAGVALLAAACAGVLLYMNLSKQPVAPAPKEPDKVVAMQPVAIDAAVPAIAVDAAEVAPPPDAAVAKPITHADKHPQPVKHEPVVVEKEKPPSGPPGFITIDSAPVYAVIYIDGKKYGETPLVHISLPPGNHAERAVSPSGAAKNLTISIDPGKTAPVRKIEW